jgi:hypothetical protein
MGSVVLVVLLFLALLAITAVVLSLTGRLGTEPRGEPAQPVRPWWSNPLVWVGVSAVFLILGLVAAPRLLGGIVLFLPLIWIRGFGRRGPGGRDRRGREPGP